MTIDATALPAQTDTPDDDGSLSDHESTFGRARTAPPVEPPDGDAGDDDEPVEPPAPGKPERPRHRAQSQKATAADVPRIQELTRKLRDAERKVSDLQARTVTPAAPVTAPVAKAVEPTTPVAPAKPTAPRFTFPEYDVWIGQHPNEDWNGYQSAMLDARDDWRDAQRSTTQQQRTDADVAAARQEVEAATIEVWKEQIATFKATTPDFDHVVSLVDDREAPALLVRVLLSDEKGAESLYTLAQHPLIYDELILAATDKTVTDQSVATLRRLLHARLQAATTGSAGSTVPPHRAPRPPNPVRTGPIKTGTPLPDDESSLAEHERAFGPKRRRAR